jgi:hypothetical protein
MRPDNAIIGHPTCVLDLQRRIWQTRRDLVARSVGRARRRSLLDRVLGRERGERPVDLDAEALRERGEDVWKALRY